MGISDMRRSVTIKCPSCGAVQTAEEAWLNCNPFPTYIHECACGYVITESDWSYADPEGQRSAWWSLTDAAPSGGEG